MTFRLSRRFRALAISILLLAVLLWVADFSAIDLSQVRPLYIVLCVALYIPMLCLRALNFQILASADNSGASFGPWAKLAARHQLVFLAAPSGSGDLAFPLIAKKSTGVDTATSTGIIVISRMRDICAILGLGLSGLIGADIVPTILAIPAAIAFIALIWVERVGQMLLYLAERFLNLKVNPDGWINTLAGVADASAKERLKRSGVTIAIWISAGAAAQAGFLAAGYPMSTYESWILIAGLNIAGALAVSVAGLGIAEVGAAGVLMLLGETATEAAAIAVIARPSLLISLVLAAFALEGGGRLLFR